MKAHVPKAAKAGKTLCRHPITVSAAGDWTAFASNPASDSIYAVAALPTAQPIFWAIE